MTYGDRSAVMLEFINNKEKISDQTKIQSASVLIDENDSTMSVIYPILNEDKREFKLVMYKNIQNKFIWHMEKPEDHDLNELLFRAW